MNFLKRECKFFENPLEKYRVFNNLKRKRFWCQRAWKQGYFGKRLHQDETIKK